MSARRWLVELCLVVAVFGTAAWWGDHYWNASLSAGRQPIFYQEYLEPAVMMACGKGFVISHPQLPAVRVFLARTTDTFSCSDISADARLSADDMYQGVWRYLMIATAACWRIRGISWTGLGPLLGLLFGATVTFAYGTFRLGMGRVLALFCAFGFSISTLHLLNLPHLRDYSKAPFTLALIFILGILVKVKANRRAVLGCAAAYGVTVGIGYGFRTDFLVNIPVFFVVLFAFLEGELLKNIPLKLAAAALCFGTFMLSAWPLITVVYRSGGCQWHTALLGLTTPFTAALELEDAPYDFGHAYADGAVYRMSTSYARRVDHVGPIAYCSHDYDVATGEYLFEVARRFPADMLTRAYASMSEISELPFGVSWLTAPLPDLAPAVYAKRLTALTKFKGTGLRWIVVALLLTSLVSGRLTFFLVFFLLYFGGYPAIQFANRHYFHLEIITWWAFGFVVHQMVAGGLTRLRRPVPEADRLNWRRAAWIMPTVGVLVVVPLLTLRWYQQTTLRGFFQKYVEAPTDQWPGRATEPGVLYAAPGHFESDPLTGEAFVVVAINTSRCDEHPAVTFRYDKAFPYDDLTRTFRLDRRSPIPDPTLIFTPVYNHFLGVEFSDTRPGCIGGVSSVRDVSRLSLLLPSVLPPHWERGRLYKRFKSWPWPPLR